MQKTQYVRTFLVDAVYKIESALKEDVSPAVKDALASAIGYINSANSHLDPARDREFARAIEKLRKYRETICWMEHITGLERLRSIDPDEKPVQEELSSDVSLLAAFAYAQLKETSSLADNKSTVQEAAP